MLELPLQDQCEVIYVPCLLANLSTGEQCIVDAVWDTGSQRTAISEEAFKAIGLTEGWTTECKVSLTEYDLWEVEVDVLPKLPVHMVISMDIISTGNLSLTYDDTGYTFRFEQL